MKEKSEIIKKKMRWRVKIDKEREGRKEGRQADDKKE